MVFPITSGVTGCPLVSWFPIIKIMSLGKSIVINSEYIRFVWLRAKISGVTTIKIAVLYSSAFSVRGVSSTSSIDNC